MMQDLSPLALLAAFAFLAVPALVSQWQRLGLTRDMVWAALRGTAQLIAIGYVLTAVFAAESWWLLALLLVLMIAVASRSASRRGAPFAGAFWMAFLAIAAAEAVALALWGAFHLVVWEGQYVLPMSGMVIGNAMTVAGLSFERMWREFEQSKPLILAKLALGATPRQACQEVIEQTVKAAMIPNIDTLRTIGLVHLPGMMTGAILAGAPPLVAVKYQVVILLTLLSGAAIVAMVISFLTYRRFFAQRLF